MSIAAEVRSYADSALAQGKQALESAQSRFSDVADDLQGGAKEFAGRAQAAPTELVELVQTRVQAGVADLTARANTAYGEALARGEQLFNNAKAVDITVAGRVISAETIFADVMGDPRVVRAVQTAGTVYGTVGSTYGNVRESVRESVQVRVVKPVNELIAKSPLANSPIVKVPFLPFGNGVKVADAGADADAGTVTATAPVVTPVVTEPATSTATVRPAAKRAAAKAAPKAAPVKRAAVKPTDN